jgi:polysaccharide biosynthesis protein PslG
MTSSGLRIVPLALVAVLACSSNESTEQPVTLGETIGVNTHYASGGAVDHDALARLAEAGVRFIRNDLTWESVEKEAGVYDFTGSGFDELVDTAEMLGLRILFILDYGNPLYGETRAVVDEEGRRAFAAFATAAARRYGGRGHGWEIWNEPNLLQFWSSADGGPDPELYVELIRSTAPALRAADPDGAIVVGALFFGLPEITEAAGLGIGGPRFLETIAATDVLSLADEVTLHLYRLDRPEGTAAEIQVARDLLDAAGYPLPVSSGEWGYSTYDPNAPPDGFNFIPAVTPNRQASYLARMLLFNYSLGLRRSVIFKDRDKQDPNPGNIEHHWGLMTWELAQKPSYVAVSTLTELLGDAGPPEALALDPGEHGLSFQRPDGSQVVALWAEHRATWLLRAEGQSDTAEVLGRDGSDITPAGLSDGAELTLDPDDGPIYLVGDIGVTSVQ